MQRFFPSFFSMKQFPTFLADSAVFDALNLSDTSAMPLIDAQIRYCARYNFAQCIFEDALFANKALFSLPAETKRHNHQTLKNPVLSKYYLWKETATGIAAITKFEKYLVLLVKNPPASIEVINGFFVKFCTNLLTESSTVPSGPVDFSTVSKLAYSVCMCPHILWQTVAGLATNTTPTWTTMLHQGLFLTLHMLGDGEVAPSKKRGRD